ncbi:N-6 DNA methylase [Sinorhizobium medicae]|nr:N-6 DNA methylase [Sinorhizobium medicae]MDX0992783.1 N-6 DNA methylase [Sinorhizobium medicae]MDX1079210.1 N-6 DNA methylase [Sinorhizobium medicae]
MLNPTEIYDNVEALVARPLDGTAFGLALMEAVGAPRATITRLHEEAATGAFTWTRMLRFEAVERGSTGPALDRMRSETEDRPKSKRPRILIAYDGETIAVRDTKIGDEQRVGIDALAYEADILFPLGGHERHVPDPERLADVRATKHLSRLFDAVRDANPHWNTPKDRHALNVFMARLLFCLFSDDVGIFEKDAFETALQRSTRSDGSDLKAFLEGAFAHMDTDPSKGVGPARGWSKLPYVNGSLFSENSPVPALDARCRRHLLDCARLDWREINPDIFGSMLQGVVDTALRGELGMHYTSPSNIMKVLRPILLDELQAELDSAGKNKEKLRAFLKRLGSVRVFDPACGSGNFLIIAYKALREMEMEAFKRLGELPHDVVALDNFYGLEIDDFATQAAQLGLWIAQYQMDELFRKELGRNRPFLPLSQAGRIYRGNAASTDWLMVCPLKKDSQTIVIGNPPFKGSKHQSKAQREDMKTVFSGRVPNSGELDYVALWFLKGADYAKATGAPIALVSTNSIVQGASVSTLWPHILDGLEIRFAHRSFKWSNLAAKNAGVTCVVVGLGIPQPGSKRLYDGDTVRQVDLIGPYLAPNVRTIVSKKSRPISTDFDPMLFGNMPLDGRNEKLLRMSRSERAAILADTPAAADFIRPILGSDELINGGDLWCIWVPKDRVEEAWAIDAFRTRFEQLAKVRSSGGADMIKVASKPWAFREQNAAQGHTIMVPAITSESRNWLPVDVKDSFHIPSSRVYAIFDGEIWQAGILSSRMHLLWMQTVSGMFETRPLYSNQLVWNTFPMPRLSDRRKLELEEHWWEIDRARKESGFDRTLGNLYSPKNMPADLRRAHEELDETMEKILGARRYRSDGDRIEHLLQLYEATVIGGAGR